MSLKLIRDHIDSDWLSFFCEQEKEGYWGPLWDSLAEEMGRARIQPVSIRDIFKVFSRSWKDMRVILVGQDPYSSEHNGKSNAMGLTFSVPKGHPLPGSLKNMLDEAGVVNPASGDLSPWFDQGVFLINSVLTVRAGPNQAGTHKRLGWQHLTKAAIRYVAENNPGVVCLGFGLDAHKVLESAGLSGGSVIKTSHPSRLGYKKDGGDRFIPFKGSDCFEKCNQLLEARKLGRVNWDSLV